MSAKDTPPSSAWPLTAAVTTAAAPAISAVAGCADSRWLPAGAGGTRRLHGVLPREHRRRATLRRLRLQLWRRLRQRRGLHGRVLELLCRRQGGRRLRRGARWKLHGRLALPVAGLRALPARPLRGQGEREGGPQLLRRGGLDPWMLNTRGVSMLLFFKRFKY